MTHPGVGPVTALAFVLIIGPVERFQRSKQVVSYLGLNPQEHSSGDSSIWIDQQAGQSHDALVAGGSGANGGAVRSGNCSACIRRLKFRRGAAWPKWPSPANLP